jgi:luciferase family oxidoreductase group 1
MQRWDWGGEVLLAHIGARTKRIRLGTGALLLPHYRPLKVVETFHLLASLYPGRIDLGIGRAPGGPAHASMALSGNFLENVRKLPETLREVLALLQGHFRYDGQPVQARPAPRVPPELWLLGTNTKSAAYAAELGIGYVFGQFMSDVAGEEVLAAYREAFQPSPLLAAPKTIAAVGAVCAETKEEANVLASRMQNFFQEESGAKTEAQERPSVPQNRKMLAGTPDEVVRQLAGLSELYGTDEFLIVTMVPDYNLRLRSYEMLAQALKRLGAGDLGE